MERNMLNMWNKKWCSVILTWVNSIHDDIQCSRFEGLKDPKILSFLLKTIYESGKKELPIFTDTEDVTNTFIKDNFPECLDKDHLSLDNEDDVLILYSLIMYSVCIKSKIYDICNRNAIIIDSDNQLVLRRFFQEMIETGEEKFTTKNVYNAIQQALGSTNTWSRQSLSPATSTSSLRDFFDSPLPNSSLVHDRKKKENEIKKLKALLDEEENEKADLVEKNQKLEKSLKATQLLLNEKTKEIITLKEELNQSFNGSPENVQYEKKEKHLLQEIKALKNELEELQLENGNLINLKDQHDKEVSEKISKIKTLEMLLDEKEEQSTEDRRKFVIIQNRNIVLNDEIEDLKQIIEQYKELSKTCDSQTRIHSLNNSGVFFEENLGQSVVDLMLKEKDDLIDQLKNQLTTEQEEHKIITDKMVAHVSDLQEVEKYLKEQVKCIEAERNELSEACSNLKEEKEQMSSRNGILESELTAANQKISVQQEEVATLTAKNTELSNTISNQENELSKLKILNESIENENNDLKCTLESKEILHGNKINSLMDDIDEKKSHISDLEESIVKLREEIVHTKDEKVSLKNIVSKHEEKISQLNIELVEKITELKIKEFDFVEIKTNLEKKSKEVSEFKNVIDSLNDELKSYKQNVLIQSKDLNCKDDTIQSMLVEINSLKEQISKHDPHLKEAHDKLFHDYNRLSDEFEAVTLANNNLTEENKNMRAEYDAKLKKIKDHMKETCTRAMQQTEETCTKKTKQLQEVVKSGQEHITQLSSQLWDTSDKLIITKKENEELKKQVFELKKSFSQQSLSLRSRRSRSYENLGHATPEKLHLEIDKVTTDSQRQSSRMVPSGMGKVFPSEDEGEEMFSNECLADLKAGHCHIPTDPDRVTIFKYRNSLCPPHLKSSYAAETQFLPIDTFTEEDIKGKAGDGDDKSLLSEKLRHKDRSQTSYKRPGPPTPSKHGGRSTSQASTTTPRNVLREVNDAQKKHGTPNKLFSQFFATRQRDENTPTTTNQRRLSFFKHFGKRDGNQKM